MIFGEEGRDEAGNKIITPHRSLSHLFQCLVSHFKAKSRLPKLFHIAAEFQQCLSQFFRALGDGEGKSENGNISPLRGLTLLLLPLFSHWFSVKHVAEI